MSINEDNIINKDILSAYKDVIGCDICLGILTNPKQCSSCQTNYCQACITNWEKKNKSCPMRCNSYEIQDTSRVVKNILSKLVIKCEFCSDNIGYDLLLKDHMTGECKNNKITCPLCQSKMSSTFDKEEIENYKKQIIAPYEAEIIKLNNDNKSLIEINKILSDELQNSGSGGGNNIIRNNNKVNIDNKNSDNNIKKQEIQIPQGANSDMYFVDDLENKISSYSNLKNTHENKFYDIRMFTSSYLSSLGKVIDLKFKERQKRKTHIFSNNFKTAHVQFSSCWNVYFTDYYLRQDYDEVFAIRVKCNSHSLSHHYIGFLADYYGNDCICQFKKGS